jgi:hypothetical protein
MIGKNDRRFNSRANHNIIQFELDIAIRVLRIIVDDVNIINGVMVVIKT